MRKKTIAIFFIIGVVIVIIGGIIYGAGLASAVNNVTYNTNGTTNVSAGLVGTALLGAAIMAIGGIFNLVAWIGALIATAKQGRWGWFVVVLLFTYLGELIYLIAGPGLG